MEEAKKMKCYKRLIYKQFVQVSGLCGPQFVSSVSYLPKRFTHVTFVELCMETPYWCTNMAAGIPSNKSRGETIFQRDSIPIVVSRTVKTRKVKLLYFRNETGYGTGNLNKDLFFVYLPPSVNKNS